MSPSDLIASIKPKPFYTTVTNGHSVDFITMLPYDVVSYILCRLTTWELCELFRVSKSWRGTIMDCSELWTKVALSYEDPIVMKEPELLFDLPISPRIQELDLLLKTNQEAYGTLLTQLAQGKFPRLKRLKMKGQPLLDTLPNTRVSNLLMCC
ncbi:hypothetical protein BJV82DRAFT_619843 [Fennellomyces sp. T-0311]|nr:hypothetical protein BJV82DRAFT_619843 [Fennellomyces sp. T-0311]